MTTIIKRPTPAENQPPEIARLSPGQWNLDDFLTYALDMFELNADIVRKESYPGAKFEYVHNLAGKRALVEYMEGHGFEFESGFKEDAQREWEAAVDRYTEAELVEDYAASLRDE